MLTLRFPPGGAVVHPSWTMVRNPFRDGGFPESPQNGIIGGLGKLGGRRHKVLTKAEHRKSSRLVCLLITP